MHDDPPKITSFIIRFVHGPSPAEPYRGTIRHIPTNQEIHFTRWQDAEEFLRRFVPLETRPPSNSESLL